MPCPQQHAWRLELIPGSLAARRWPTGEVRRGPGRPRKMHESPPGYSAGCKRVIKKEKVRHRIRNQLGSQIVEPWDAGSSNPENDRWTCTLPEWKVYAVLVVNGARL